MVAAPVVAAPSAAEMPPVPILRESVLKNQMPEKNAKTTSSNPELIKAQEHARKLREYNESHKDPRESMKRGDKSIPPLNDNERKQLEKVDPELAKEARQFDDYSTVVDTARRTHKSIEDVCKEQKIKGSDFEANQKAVVNQMMKASSITDRIQIGRASC